MTEETNLSRRSLATFLRGKSDATAPPALAAAPTEDGFDPPAPTSPQQAASAAAIDVAATDADINHHATTAVELERQKPGPATPTAIAETGPDLFADLPLEQPIAATTTEDAAAVAATPAPSFVHVGRGSPVAATPYWQFALIAVLAVVLLLQVAIADRANLAANAATRPMMVKLCAVLRCTLPPWNEPDAFSMLSRDIRPVSAEPGVLQVQASFRNDARWTQAWPALRLSLSDADGRVIARRRFEPAEYLDAAYAPGQTLEPQQSAHVSFRLREPAATTVAFSFDFQ